MVRARHGRIPDNLERFYNLRGLRHPQPTFYASNPKTGEGGGPSKLTRSRRHLKICRYAQNFEIAPRSRELTGLKLLSMLKLVLVERELYMPQAPRFVEKVQSRQECGHPPHAPER